LIVLKTFLEILFYISVFSNLHMSSSKAFSLFEKLPKDLRYCDLTPQYLKWLNLSKIYSGHCLMQSWIMLSVGQQNHF
jgi:hypothetical protein